MRVGWLLSPLVILVGECVRLLLLGLLLYVVIDGRGGIGLLVECQLGMVGW